MKILKSIFEGLWSKKEDCKASSSRKGVVLRVAVFVLAHRSKLRL